MKPYKRGGVYYVRGTYRGVYVHDSLGVRELGKAEDLITRMKQRILDGELHGKSKVKTFWEGVATYWDKGGKYGTKVLGKCDEVTGEWSKLIGEFYDTPMSEITEDDLLDYCRRKHPNAKAATWNRDVISPVKAVLKKNKVKTYLDIDKLEEERVETPHASPDLLGETLQAYSDLPHLCALVLTSAATGRRLGELIEWRREKIDWGRGEVYTGKTKNGHPITVRIPPRILPVLETLPEFENGRLFGYSTNSSMRAAMVRRCDKAGIPYLSMHKIGRHTFATWARKYLGKDIAWIKEAGGWRSLSAVERYVHVNPTEAQVESGRLLEVVPMEFDLPDPRKIRAVRNIKRKNDDKSDT